jgi:hypothetical protein
MNLFNDKLIKPTMTSHLSSSDLLHYNGDAIVLPCYQDIMHVGKYAQCLRRVLDKAGPQLIQELSITGEMEMFHVRLTKGYDLPTPHIIFYACLNDNPEFTLSSLDWHEIWSSVAMLARLYKFKTLGIKMPVTLMPPHKNLLYRITSAFQQKALDGDAITILHTILISDNPEEHVEVSLFL